MKDSSVTMSDLIAAGNKELGEKLELGRLATMRVGSFGVLIT